MTSVRVRFPSKKGDEVKTIDDSELYTMLRNGTHLIVGQRMVPQPSINPQSKTTLTPTVDASFVEKFAIQNEQDLAAEIAKASNPEGSYSITLLPRIVGG